MASASANIHRTVYDIKGFSLPMITVPPGHFWMGNDESKYNDKKPEHWVNIESAFELGEYLGYGVLISGMAIIKVPLKMEAVGKSMEMLISA